MRGLKRYALLLAVVAILVAGCNLEGVAGFSPNNDRVAVVTKVGDQYRLYTTDANGGNPVKIEDNVNGAYDVTFDPVGNRLLYIANNQICTSAVTGGGKSCPVAVSGGLGFLAFLPNGDYIFVVQSSGKYTMDVYRPAEATPYKTESNIDHFFLTADAFKVRRLTKGTQWYIRPYDKPSGQQNLRFVFVRGTTATMYNGAGSLEGPTALPREVNSAVNDALKNRDQSDITSGVISPDGTKMIFRTRTGTDPNYTYGLYTLDLGSNTGSFVQLVSNANFRVQFAFSPTGQEVVYESNTDGRSVWIASADGSNLRKLADNASLPTWN